MAVDKVVSQPQQWKHILVFLEKRGVMLFLEESRREHAGNLHIGHHHFCFQFFVDVCGDAVP